MMKSVLKNRLMNRDRRGSILVLSAVIMTFILAMVAFSVDMGYMAVTKTQLQAAADASALAGALELSGTEDPAIVRANARAAINSTAALHRNGDQSTVSIEPSDIAFGKMSWSTTQQKYIYEWGDGYTPYNVVRVRADRDAGSSTSADERLPLFFGGSAGMSKAQIGAEAIASFQPRDIMVVLDFSGSMNDDSCFGRISTLGRPFIEGNMLKMWQELGSPVYGKLTFTPQYATLGGVPASGTIPHIDVTYKRTSVTVASTQAITQVRLQFSNGSSQIIPVGGGTTTATYAGTGSYAGQTIINCWVRSGTNASMSSGNNGEQFAFTAANIKSALGLNIAYPYPGGSWSEYISVVQSSSGSIKNAGYRDMFGYMTWIEYLQTYQYGYDDTPDLWKTSEQPIGILKDGVDEFINYLKTIEAEDQIGLSIYTHWNAAGAILEHQLSQNLDQIKTTTRRRQAGHYKSGTNISAGMKVARDEIVARARPRAFRMMVVMTDGLPNEPSNASQCVIDEAYAAKANKIKILTISLGVGADTSLMQQVADITGGVHFNVPGGASIDTVRAQLQEVFRRIASSRPLRLVSGK
jgi:Flp pilus assembly protein TadG